jgi:hypothetical protein
MVTGDYGDWALYHAQLFGLDSPAEASMLRAWVELFAAERIAPEELTEASKWLAVNDPPRFRSDHLAKLMERVKGLRRAAAAAPAPSGPDLGTCTLCAGSGFVIVPLVQGVTTFGGHTAEGDHDERTCTVLCRCFLGKWKAHRLGETPEGKRRAMMTLDCYEGGLPKWREIEAGWKKAKAKRVEANNHAMALDKSLGSILKRAQEQAGGR